MMASAASPTVTPLWTQVKCVTKNNRIRRARNISTKIKIKMADHTIRTRKTKRNRTYWNYHLLHHGNPDHSEKTKETSLFIP